ncbi:MAG: BrnT family toxin [Gordonibacter sp.]|uniref:BrnT family toxin n=1 Tax=Gordonibacter sp. TaxID=1968902 RepID=UPI002FCAE0A7
MIFIYDQKKSEANFAKHGIDFDQARMLWEDDRSVVLVSPYTLEERHLVIGMIEGKYWVAIVTYRGEATRIISVRRARKKEVDYYGQENQC